MVLTHEGLVAEINENWSFQDKAADEAAAARTHAQYRSVLKALMDRRSQGSCARRAALADRLATALAGDDEVSRGALVFDGGASAGAELLPGGARGFCRRAARARGYTLLAWVREAKHCGRFEAFGVGRGGTRVVVTPGERDEGVAWSVEVFSGGKSRGVVERQIDDGDDADDGGAGHGADGTAPGLYAPRWRLLAVTHAQKYLSGAEVQVSVDGLALGAPLVVPMPSPDDAERDDGSAPARSSARAALKPPAVRALHGFAGYCAAVVAFEGAVPLNALRVAFWRGPRSGVGAGAGYARSGFGRRTDDPEGSPRGAASEAKFGLDGARVCCALDPCRVLCERAHDLDCGEMHVSLWAPRGQANPGGRAVELGLGGGPAPCGALQGDGEASGLLRGGVVATRGAAAAARDAVVAGGGATAVAVAALSDLANGDGSPAERAAAVAAALRLLGAALRRCGARHAAAALEDRAVPRAARRLGAAASSGAVAATPAVCDGCWAVLDACGFALGGGSALQAQALRCLWADADVIEAASDEDRVAWLERAALKCSADARSPLRVRRAARLFGAAFRVGVGVARLARLARRALPARAPRGLRAADLRRRGGAALKHLATAALVDEFRRPGSDERSEGVAAVVDAVHDDADDADGAVRGALAGALVQALARGDDNLRARVARQLRSAKFAEATALAILGSGGGDDGSGCDSDDTDDDAGPLISSKTPHGPRAPPETPTPAPLMALRAAALELALWQYVAAERSLRLALQRAKADVGPDDGDGDDGLGASRRVAECARAIHTFRASALRSVATLATFAASALDAGAWRFGGEADAERFLDVLGVDLVRLPDGGDGAPRRAAGAPRLACPPLWLALPFVAALSRHCPRACCERVVAAVCVRVKSHEPTLVDVAELEPWYGVGSLVRLARCGYDTVELLALDAVGAVVLRRRSAASPDDFDGAGARDSASFENSYDVDGRALAQLTALLGAREPRASPAAPRLGDRWARAAFCAVAASAFRRLAADATRYERATCDCVARLLAVALDCVWPPPADDGAHDAGDDGDAGAALAEAVTEVARSLRRASDRRRADAPFPNDPPPPPGGDSRSPSPPARSILAAARAGASRLSQIAADRRAKSDADDAADRADASLLAIRRCGRALAHALVRATLGAPALAARVAVELRASVAAAVELGDERVARGAHSAAQVACDDALHALRCARALRRRAAASAASPEDARLLGGVADAAVVGLVRDSANSIEVGGIAAACARAALSDGADAARAGDAAGALAALAARLDAAGASDAAELLEFDGDVHGAFDDDGGDSPEPRRGGWLDPGDAKTNLSRRAAAALAAVAVSRGSAAAGRRAAAARDAAARAALDRGLAAAEADARLEAFGEPAPAGQVTWAVRADLGGCLANPSKVCDRGGAAPHPLKAHDDHEELANDLRRAEASHIKVMSAKKATVDAADLAKRLDIKAKLATPAAAPADDDDDDDGDEPAAPDQPKDGAPAPAPAAPRDDDDADAGPPGSDEAVVAALDAVSRVTRLGLVRGAVALTESRLVFSARGRDKVSWRFQDVVAVLMRRYRLRDCGFEVYVARGASFFCDCCGDSTAADRARSPSFDDDGDETASEGAPDDAPEPTADDYARFGRQRDDFARRLIAAVRLARARSPRRADAGAGVFPLLQAPRSHPARLLRRATRAWQERRLSNFGYLLVANALAGRSFADPCQYPVFPWVLADYSSEDLDLDDPRVYRDLAKPMGALNGARLRETVDRYEAFDDTYMPRFHYGSHYSTAAGVVVHYLLRTEPFGSLHCDLQGGRFDVADRLFASVAEAWDANSGARGEKSGSEVKELTPEWYCAPAFLTNRGRLPLGASQDGEAVGDVALPPWARGSPETFVRALRAALESDHASRHLHAWIDLVFGHKQRGPGAVEARNVFFYLCYADAVDVDAIEDPKLKAATILQASHFGQCPTQLLARRPHAPRGPPPAHHCRCLRVRESARRVDPRTLALALEPGPDKLALARCASLLHNFRAGPVVALRATASRVVAVDAGGNVCALAWSYDAADEGNDEAARRVHLRPLAAPDELQSLKGGGFAGQATDCVETNHWFGWS